MMTEHTCDTGASKRKPTRPNTIGPDLCLDWQKPCIDQKRSIKLQTARNPNAKHLA